MLASLQKVSFHCYFIGWEISLKWRHSATLTLLGFRPQSEMYTCPRCHFYTLDHAVWNWRMKYAILMKSAILGSWVCFVGHLITVAVDALNAVFKKWSKQNPQLTTLLEWSLIQHPCNNFKDVYLLSTGNPFPGAWRGVGCYAAPQNVTDFRRYYHISVISLVWVSSPRLISSSHIVIMDIHVMLRTFRSHILTVN